MLLTSLKNPKVKYIYKLRNRRFRDKERKTLLEGFRELSRSFDYGMKLLEVYYCPSMFLGENEFPLIENLKEVGVEAFEVTEPILEKLSYRDRPEGLIAVAEIKSHLLSDIPVKKDGLYLLAESIEKPGNLGSIMRSADAAAVTGVILCDKCTDIYNPNVIRASTGALFTVPLAEATTEEVDEWLKTNDIKVLAATPHTNNIHTDVDMTEAVAIAVGTEQTGLTDFWMERAELKVKIPMLGKIDSLNVATATTILLYEDARQRNWKVSN
jgi:TrmH family RNA methyltransferase